jgi:hypothetical protein
MKSTVKARYFRFVLVRSCREHGALRALNIQPCYELPCARDVAELTRRSVDLNIVDRKAVESSNGSITYYHAGKPITYLLRTVS